MAKWYCRRPTEVSTGNLSGRGVFLFGEPAVGQSRRHRQKLLLAVALPTGGSVPSLSEDGP
eukprot:16445974-Heterocapsa_arctica.AAC.1